MRPVIFANSFARAGLPETLAAVTASGPRTIQFNVALTGDHVPTRRSAHVDTSSM